MNLPNLGFYLQNGTVLNFVGSSVKKIVEPQLRPSAPVGCY